MYYAAPAGTLYWVRNLGVVCGWAAGVLLIGSISCTMDAVRLTAAAEPQMGFGSLAAVQPAVLGSDTDMRETANLPILR
jgi:hypothetical protein